MDVARSNALLFSCSPQENVACKSQSRRSRLFRTMPLRLSIKSSNVPEKSGFRMGWWVVGGWGSRGGRGGESEGAGLCTGNKPECRTFRYLLQNLAIISRLSPIPFSTLACVRFTSRKCRCLPFLCLWTPLRCRIFLNFRS
jgi:hypothetical protein